jgi:putative glycosyltransferase (TIGR04372 family)
MSVIPEIFRIPVIYTNWTLIGLLITSSTTVSGLVIFKKFYLKKEKLFMTFSEIMNLEFGGRDTNEIFASLNLELIENTPEEIRTVTIEMDERLNGTWQTTPDDEELQKRFWALFGPDKLKSPDLRIGAEYLRDNQELLK